ncbi:hypothetical protein MMC28_008668, partial [Mycoblastus sanguinarius]|nr:hypothetical protein [Mycoblastus sanguinarius]
NDNHYYPSRLIEIGEAADDLVYLQERDGASFSGDYIALSHCWGKTPMTKLVSTQEEAPKAEFLVPLTTD